MYKINTNAFAITVWGFRKEEDKGWTAEARTETQETVGWYESSEWSCPERTGTVAGNIEYWNEACCCTIETLSWNFYHSFRKEHKGIIKSNKF